MNFMGNGYDMESTKALTIINDILKKKLKRTVARTISNGKTALEQLRKIGYIDTPTCMYGCIGAFKKGVYPHFHNVYTKFSDIRNKGCFNDKNEPLYFDFENGRYEVIIHAGAPDMTDPIKWFFGKYLKFWHEWNDLNNFVSPTYPNNASMKIIGAYQPLECLSHIWPMDSVVPFKDILKYYEENKDSLGQVIDEDVETED